MSREDRWPGWVYGGGEEPDVRFTLANERTFLAWIRTAMAFLAGGVAVDVVDLDLTTSLQRTLSVVLLGLGVLSAVASWVRWARSERALRRREPLPAPGAAPVITALLVLVGVALIVATLL